MSGEDHSQPPLEELPLAAQVEAVLFVADRPVTVGELCKLLQAPPDAVEDALAQLADGYRGRGLSLQRHGDALQLVTASRAAPAVQRFLGLEMSSRLSAAALETLAIVAYRQPVTRSQIEQIRGVSADYALGNLLMRGLVEEVGRLETVGRPILFGTTFEFLRTFGLTSLDDLPPAEEFGASVGMPAAASDAAATSAPPLQTPRDGGGSG